MEFVTVSNKEAAPQAQSLDLATATKLFTACAKAWELTQKVNDKVKDLEKLVIVCDRLKDLQKQLDDKIDKLAERIAAVEKFQAVEGTKPKTKRKRGYKEWKFVMDMIKQGSSYKQIADVSGIPYSTVAAYGRMSEDEALVLPGSIGIELPPPAERKEEPFKAAVAKLIPAAEEKKNEDKSTGN